MTIRPKTRRTLEMVTRRVNWHNQRERPKPGSSCDYFSQGTREPVGTSSPNIVLWYIDSLVALSGGGYVDPRWTTTLTAFDSKDEATGFVALRLSSLFNIYPHGRFTCRSERPSDDNARPHPYLSAHKLPVPRILLTPPDNTFPSLQITSKFFHKLTMSGLPLDNAALSAGLEERPTSCCFSA